MKANSFFFILLLLPLFAFQACGQSKDAKNNEMTAVESKSKNPYYSHTDTTKLNLTDAEWKKILPEDVYLVSRKADTESL